jgi:hypothetical protein
VGASGPREREVAEDTVSCPRVGSAWLGGRHEPATGSIDTGSSQARDLCAAIDGARRRPDRFLGGRSKRRGQGV